MRDGSAKKVFMTVLMVLVIGAACFAGWYYYWTTHATFDYQLQPIVILEGQKVTARDFIHPNMNTEGISIAFTKSQFVPFTGQQYVQLTLTLGWRTVEAIGELYVMTPLEQIATEFAYEKPALNPVNLLANARIADGVAFDVHFIEEPLPLADYEVGDYILYLSLNGAPFEVKLVVEDTTPPTARSVDVDILIGEEVSPEDFVKDVFDDSPPVTVSFVNEPDVFAHEDQTVEIALEDSFGNIEILRAHLTIQLNEKPPVINGLKTIESMLVYPVDYLEGITAFDDFDRELEIEVDDSGVDVLTVGMYTVTYLAEDFTGNIIEEDVTVFIIDVDMKSVDVQIESICAEIITGNMKQIDKVKAIFKWIRENVSSKKSDDEDDEDGPLSIYEGAYMALREKRVNSFMYSALAELLLNRAGIPNMRIRNEFDSETPHVWNLINTDDSGWHHFDSMPTGIKDVDAKMFKFGNSDAKKFAKEVEKENEIKNYYTYDPELYPEIAE